MDKSASSSSRATTLEELEQIIEKIFSEESWEQGLAFRPSPSDIIISPYAKSGTTWMQQIVHGLRTRGSMDFDEITAVTPWIEVAHTMDWDLDAPQVAEPRVFKSHLNWRNVPKGARYICVFRNPHDVMVSFYRFLEGWWIEPDRISLETFIHWRLSPGNLDEQGYWQHLVSWWKQRHNEDVLLLSYEDMKADLPAVVRIVARFIAMQLDDDLLDIVVRQSSREFMLAHANQFDESYMRRVAAERAGLPLDSDADKVTPGSSNDVRYQISPALKEELNNIWREHVQPHIGFQDYDELRHALRPTHS